MTLAQDTFSATRRTNVGIGRQTVQKARARVELWDRFLIQVKGKGRTSRTSDFGANSPETGFSVTGCPRPPALGMGCFDSGHQVCNGPFEPAKPVRQARRDHDYIAWPHPSAPATLNGASDAGASGF